MRFDSRHRGDLCFTSLVQGEVGAADQRDALSATIRVAHESIERRRPSFSSVESKLVSLRRATIRNVTSSVLPALLLLGLAAPAHAQDAAKLKKDMVGQWELSTTERSKTCVVTMKNDATPLGFKLDLEPSCATALPFTKAITAWSVKGLDIVRLQDAQGQSVIDFTEVEAGILEGLRTNEGVYLLQNLVAARAQSKSMDQMIGNWSVTRGTTGRSICALTLTNNDAGSDNFQIFVKPRCEQPVSGFAPTVWRLERGEILMQSPSGEIWRFEADDNAQWRRVPDSADPLILVRQ